MKKIRLRTMQSDTKIFREVNALSRLSHRNIVRYYTTWVETSDPQSTAASDDLGSEIVTEDGRTSVPETSERHLPINGGFYIDIEDFDDLSVSRSSFPSIHFGRSGSTGTTSPEEDSNEDDGFGSLFRSASSESAPSLVAPPTLSMTLYIQMACYFYLSLFFLIRFVFLGICGTSDLERSLFLNLLFRQKHHSKLGFFFFKSWLMKAFLKTKLGVCFYRLSTLLVICRLIQFFIEISS